MNIVSFIKKNNVVWKVKAFEPFLTHRKKILDFGCGDLTFAKELRRIYPSISVTGVDVFKRQEKQKDVRYVSYSGKSLPFKDASFDSVVSIYVFHHCDSAEKSYSECLRVAKNNVIFIEAIPRNAIDLLFMKFMDWLYNVWKKENVLLPYQFLTLSEWKKIFKKSKVELLATKEIRNFLSILPVGKAYLFVLKKQK